ncbi:VWA domain-containing protein [Catellatospora sichuanensis]|uniref:VWA domain-containing protein n=1 Tax=Catellatospora sichuanensis TaxID=1969805 RepID=UPI00118279C8|nr:VWA domain-containing protein [Catellatospora sichuanensis]
MKRRLGLAALPAAVFAMVVGLAAAPAAAADPALSISGQRQQAGLLEFYLSAQDLPAGTALDTVAVKAGDRSLETTSKQVASAANAAARRGVTLVLDTSGSMAGAPIQAARAAARRYLDLLPGDVEIGLVTAGAPATVVLPPTKDRAAAGRAIDALAAKGETALYDGVRLAAGQLSKGEWGQRRIVALSDGADTASAATLAAARQSAGAVAVDTIAFATPDTTAGILAGLSTATGGKAFTAADATALSAAFAEASGSFSAQLLVQVTVPAELSGQQVRLTVTAGGVSTEMPVALAVDTRAAGPLEGKSGGAPGLTWLLVIAGLVFAGLLGAALLVVGPMFAASDRRQRLSQVNQFVVAPRRASASADGSSQVTAAALALSEQVMKSANVEGRFATQLDRAGMRLRPHEWLLVRALAGLVAGLWIGLVLAPLAGLVLGPLVGWLVTSLYHRNRAAKRVTAFREMLPEALQLVVGSLRSGFSLTQAIDAMARELSDPIASEFGRALGEARLGVDIEDALDRVATRMRSKDLAWAVVAVRVQRDIGGNLAEVLSTTVEMMRERETLHREVSSLSAEGRLSAWVLLALPIGVGAFMFFSRGEYVRPLYTDMRGIVMLSVGVLLLLTGGFWLSRMIKIEV